MQSFIFLLPSGRGIKFRRLKPSETDKIAIQVETELGKDALPVERRVSQSRAGVRAFLTGYTKKTSFKKQEELIAEGVAWEPLSAGLFTDGSVDYDEIFSAKDDSFICAIYSNEHEVTRAEVDAILGKVLPVSED